MPTTTKNPIYPLTTTQTLRKTPFTTKPRSTQLNWTPIKNKIPKMPTKTNSRGKATDKDDSNGDGDPYWDGDFPVKEKNQMVHEQTLRMLHMHIHFLTHGKKFMGINKEEFVYLRIAKNILLKTCPETEVPKPLLNSVVRLFRYALYESIEVYSYTEFTDKEEDSRILDSLTNCYNSAYGMTFKYNNHSCQNSKVSDFNNTENIFWNLASFMSETLKKFIYVPCLQVIEAVIHNSEEYNATIPQSLAFNGTSLDFVLESIWKIMLHSHYYCAKNFASNPADLSSLMIKWEAFFSPMLRYRWYDTIHSLYK